MLISITDSLTNIKDSYIDRLDEVMVQIQPESLITPMLLLDPIFDEIKTLIEYHSAYFTKVKGAYAVTVGYRGDAPLTEALRSSFRPDLPDNAAAWIGEHWGPMFVADLLDDTPVTQLLKLRIHRRLGDFSINLRSLLHVPLFAGDQLLGQLVLFHREPEYYASQDVALVQEFVNRRAKEIEYAVSYADAVLQADEAQSVLTVQQAIVRRLEADAILQEVAEEVLRLTAARRALVFLCQEDLFRLVSVADSPTYWLPVGWDKDAPIDSALLSKALENGKPISFGSREDQVQAGATGLLALKSQTLLVYPIQSEHQDQGAIVAADKLMGTFGPNDEHVVAVLAASAVIGLENARAHSQAQRLARMEERQRIAQSLHDTVAQMLFGIGLAIKRAIEAPAESESVHQDLEFASRLSARSIEELRSAIFALGQPDLREGHGLIDLLQELVQEFQSESGVEAVFFAPENITELRHPVGEAIYRIIRESLNNVRKHAQATNVEVRLQSTPNSILVTVRDDGIGLDEIGEVQEPCQKLHFGIETMRRLAVQVKGEFSIFDNKRGGVTVKVRLPISEGIAA